MLASVLGYCRAILIFGNLARFTTLYVIQPYGKHPICSTDAEADIRTLRYCKDVQKPLFRCSQRDLP